MFIVGIFIPLFWIIGGDVAADEGRGSDLGW